MKYVYILQSQAVQDKFYIGCTTDLERRLQEHNSGKSIYTNKYKPWDIKLYIAFKDSKKADLFETYLKTGNGRNFIKKRFGSTVFISTSPTKIELVIHQSSSVRRSLGKGGRSVRGEQIYSLIFF